MRARESLRRVEDESELAREACALTASHARAAVAERGSFHLALAGGSTPRRLYEELAHSGASFERWQLWFSDERCVAPQDPASNFRMAAESGLLARVPAPQVHRLQGEAEPAGEARRYAAELVAALGEPPHLDLVLLGLGGDGHTASLFPGTAALAATEWVTVGRAPSAPHARLTLTLTALREARALLFLVAGADKARALDSALLPTTASTPPAGLVYPRAGTLTWLATRAAAMGVAVEGFEPPTRGL